MPLTLTVTKKNEVVVDLPDGREVVVRLVLNQGSQVRIGIDAPEDINIRRRDRDPADAADPARNP